MSVIKFPKHGKDINKDYTVETDLGYEHRLLLEQNAITFTCPCCSKQATFTQTSAIIKQIEFYCSGCGTKHYIKNPAFFEPTKNIGNRKSK